MNGHVDQKGFKPEEDFKLLAFLCGFVALCEIKDYFSAPALFALSRS